MDRSNQTPQSRVTDEHNVPLQFTIRLPPSNPNPNIISAQNPNFNANFHPNHPSWNLNLLQSHLVSTPIPTRGRRGSRRNRYLLQVHNLPSSSVTNAQERSTSLPSTSGQMNKDRMENWHNAIPEYPGPSSNFSNSTKKTVNDVSDEIIVINKEATTEASIALTAGFPADSLTVEEIDAEVVEVEGGIEQINYILIRNHIIAKWRENVSNWLTKDMFVDCVPNHCGKLLDNAYNYLVSHGYVNFGVAPGIKEKILLEQNKQSVIVIGAGLAGLAAARQLMAFGFNVTVLEGRKRAGGRVYTKKMEGGNRIAAADLGGSVLTGTSGNPLGILARQLSCTLHKVRDKCPLYGVDGKPVDPYLDQKVEVAFNDVLDKISKLRQSMGDVSQLISLGAALGTFQQVHGDVVTEEEMNLFNWHLANLEYANAGLLSKLSLAFWDQDDPYDMGGDHCFLPGGNGSLVEALVENVPIVYEKTVQTVNYGSDGVQVIAGGQVYEGDMALCTVSLGVLKSGSIKFIPELPQRKLDGIKRLGFGLLNKVAMLFPHVFWSTDLDTFGHLSEDPHYRGQFFLFYSYATVAGGPLLIALVAGEAAHKFETMPPTDAVTCVLQILKGIYEPQGIEVPEPIQTVCTRWGSDPFSFGSYSNVAVGASGDDYDILAESVGEGRLFFAGEATTRRYPATMHGALLSGFREAANIAYCAGVRASRSKVEKNTSKNPYFYGSTLADLFREPDLEFGSFSVIFGRENSKSMAIVKVTIRLPRKKPDQPHSSQLLFEQLKNHFNQQQEFPIYLLLPTQQVMDLREVRGDEMRVNYLSEKLGVKLFGRKGLGPAADSVIASIKAERSKGRPSNPLKPGTSKSKAASLRQKVIRRAKIVGNKNSHSLPSANVGTKVISGISSIPGLNLRAESREVDNNSNFTHPNSDFGLGSSLNSNCNLAPPNSNVSDMLVGDISGTIPQDLRNNNDLHPTASTNLGAREFSSNNNLGPPNSGSVSMSMRNICISKPQTLGHGSDSTPSSNIGTRTLSSNNDLYPSSDLSTGVKLMGITGGSNPQYFAISDSILTPSSNIETAALSSNSSLVPQDSCISSSNPQNDEGETLISHNSIPTEENIFDDIMNELLPPSSTNSATWRFTGKF